MNRTRFPGRGGVLVLAGMLAFTIACSDDSTGPVIEDPFDPTFAVEVVQNVMGQLDATEVRPMMGNITFALGQAAGVSGEATTIPGTGSTYVYDEGDLRWEVDPGRAGAPTDGVRFVWYAMDANANTPIRPLQERGWVDIRLEQTGESDAIMEVAFVQVTGGVETEAAAYTITHSGDIESGSFSIAAEGAAGEVAFVVERSFSYGEEGVYEALASFGGEDGLITGSVEAFFDPVTGEETVPGQFTGSILSDFHYLLVESEVDFEVGTLDGTIESDEESVLEVGGTVMAPVFRLPAGGSPSLDVQADMVEVWDVLWGTVGEGIGLLTVLENVYH